MSLAPVPASGTPVSLDGVTFANSAQAGQFSQVMNSIGLEMSQEINPLNDAIQKAMNAPSGDDADADPAGSEVESADANPS